MWSLGPIEKVGEYHESYGMEVWQSPKYVSPSWTDKKGGQAASFYCEPDDHFVKCSLPMTTPTVNNWATILIESICEKLAEHDK